MQLPFAMDEADRRRRRVAVAAHPTLIGLDSVRVLDRGSLELRFIPAAPGVQKVTAPASLAPGQLRIAHVAGDLPLPLHVAAVERAGDGFVLRLASGPGGPAPVDVEGLYRLELLDVAGLDPLFADAELAFGAGAPTERDPLPPPQPRRLRPPSPEIDYLTKDYASFRQLMLDRLAVLMPGWAERHAADLGITLVELLAHAADQLSYYQDAVATEAYLGTARRRVSVRRHARLIDYAMHDGCSARVWAQVEVAADTLLPRGTLLLTRVPGQPPRFAPGTPAHERCLAQDPEPFETLADAELFAAHNAIPLYSWGAADAALPAGATTATLQDARPDLPDGQRRLAELRPGQALLLQGAGSQPLHHTVRLVAVRPGDDPLTDTAVVAIVWHADDALPAPLPLGDASGPAMARGNLVLADHGRSVAAEPLPAPTARGRYSPVLRQPGLAFVAPAPDTSSSAGAALRPDPRAATPALTLREAGDARWQPRPGLLDSDSFARDFVVEIEDDGAAVLRFGDDLRGRRPAPGLALQASYRVGGGRRGNIGPGALGHIVSADPRIVAARNLTPAAGGADPEPIEQVRLLAPYAFRSQERCVTAGDYQAMAARQPGVASAAAALRWTGSWHTAVVAVQRADGLPADADFCERVRAALEPCRMLGHDLEVRPPRFVPLNIALRVYAVPDAFVATLRQRLREALGPRGFFQPARLGFGQPVYLSHLVAEAAALPGVLRVEVERFQCWGQDARGEHEAGRIAVGPLEIARLDANPLAPQLGLIGFTIVGGR